MFRSERSGGGVYLVPALGGFRCLWGQRIDSFGGLLIGLPYPARHFHGFIGAIYGFEDLKSEVRSQKSEV